MAASSRPGIVLWLCVCIPFYVKMVFRWMGNLSVTFARLHIIRYTCITKTFID